MAKNGRDAGRKTSAELVVAVGSKTFNNWFGFERGLWQRKTDSFESVPKRSVFGLVPNGCCADRAAVRLS